MGFSLFKQSKRKNTEQLRYLSQSVLIEEAITPHMIRSTLMVVSIAIIIFIGWAAATKVDEVAIALGEVVPSQYMQSIQHLEGGIVSKIHIKEGDLVQKGQLLMKLDGTSVKQDLLSLKLRQVSLLHQKERLTAFINHSIPDFEKIEGGTAQFKEEQKKIFDSMWDEKISEENVIEQQIKQKKEALEMSSQRLQHLNDNLILVQKEWSIKKKLADQGAISKVKFFEIGKSLNDINGLISETKSQITQDKGAINEYENKWISIEAENHSQAYQALDSINMEFAQNEEKTIKLTEQVGRLKITSPSYGLVKSLKVKTIGGVVAPGQLIVEIVPLEGDLLVECKIAAKDIGHVKKGQNVSVKISAYDFSRYGVVGGKLEYISATTFTAEDNSRYYLGRISLDKNYVGKNDKENLIVPGMTVQSDIVTGKKSVLAYLLKPIHSSLNSAFKER